MRQSIGAVGKRSLVRRRRVGGRSMVAWRDGDSCHGGELLHWRRGPCVALIWHVPRVDSSRVLRWRHAVVALRSVSRIVRVHVIHGLVLVLLRVVVLVLMRMLVMALMLMLLIPRHVLRRPPSRPARHVAAVHVHDAARVSSCRLYALLPSRQMAVTQPAGLGYRTVSSIAQSCDSRIYMHCRSGGSAMSVVSQLVATALKRRTRARAQRCPPIRCCERCESCATQMLSRGATR
jgi:hypothetical protein